MVLAGKLVAQTEIKASGDVFHDIVTNRPHHVADMSPSVHRVSLVSGEWGKVGNVARTHYTIAGKKEESLETIEIIDEEKQLVKYKILEGDLMQKYNNFYLTIHVEKKSEDIKLISWTCEYEKLNENVPEPFAFLEFLVDVTKHIECHHS